MTKPSPMPPSPPGTEHVVDRLDELRCDLLAGGEVERQSRTARSRPAAAGSPRRARGRSDRHSRPTRCATSHGTARRPRGGPGRMEARNTGANGHCRGDRAWSCPGPAPSGGAAPLLPRRRGPHRRPGELSETAEASAPANTRGSPAGPSRTIRAPAPAASAAPAASRIATTSSPGRNHPSTARQVRPAPTTHRGHRPFRPGPDAPGLHRGRAGRDR